MYCIVLLITRLQNRLPGGKTITQFKCFFTTYIKKTILFGISFPENHKIAWDFSPWDASYYAVSMLVVRVGRPDTLSMTEQSTEHNSENNLTHGRLQRAQRSAWHQERKASWNAMWCLQYSFQPQRDALRPQRAATQGRSSAETTAICHWEKKK